MFSQVSGDLENARNGQLPSMFRNNPFFQGQGEPETQNTQSAFAVDSRPQMAVQPQQFYPQYEQAQPQQQQFAVDPQQQLNMQGMYPQQQYAQVPQQFVPQMQMAQMAPMQQPVQKPAEGLPGKAFQFLTNIKNMISEGRNTVDAVRAALTDEQPQAQAQPQFPQGFGQAFGGAQMPQMPQMMPQQMFQAQQQIPQQQQAMFGGLQSLMQTEAQAAPAAPAGGDMLSALASLLNGGAQGQNAAPALSAGLNSNQIAQNLGLTNLAQLLATTTGTPSAAMPKPVQGPPGADSATLGMQEMQNMIQEASG
jgi:hypothetical protein